jgi:NAD(P)-dependent dehydrogenase (short-subunit alcohol dehydrogenase family)
MAPGKAALLRFAECVGDTLAGTGVLVFAMDPGLVRTAMTKWQPESESGRKYLTDVPRLFERGIDVLRRPGLVATGSRLCYSFTECPRTHANDADSADKQTDRHHHR